MTLLAPWAMWFCVIAAAVVALYLLKLRRQRETVPALEFWRDLAGQTQVRSLFRRIKRWLSLALWLLIVACLIVSLGNPVFSIGRVKPQSIAIVLDNSASMQAIETGPDGTKSSRWREALKAIDELTSRRPVSDSWMLIEAERQPRVLTPWTLDRESLRDAAAAVTPRLGSADLASGCRLAAQLLVGRERPCIVVISDGADGEVGRLAASDSMIVHWPVGRTTDNVGITRLSVRVQRELGIHHAFIRIGNAGTQRLEMPLVLEIDGSTTAVEPLVLEPHGVWEKSISFNRPLGGVLKARLDRDDALPADNEAYAILEPIRSAAVCLVTSPEESFFFEQALLAMEGFVDADGSRTLTPAEYDAAEAGSIKADLTIFNNASPRKLPPSGAFVFINSWPAEIPARIVGLIDGADLTLATRDHPLVRYVSTAAVSLAKARRVEAATGSIVLAKASDGSPLVFLNQGPDRTALCLAFDVMDSDLPFRNAFPLLLRNAVAYLVSQDRAWIDNQYAIGSIIRSRRPLPPRISQVSATRPNAGQTRSIDIPVTAGSFAFDGTQSAGPLRFSIGDETAYTAINLADASETRVAPNPPQQPPAERLALTGRLFGAMPWLALAVIAAGLIGLEWLTYHFRWTE